MKCKKCGNEFKMRQTIDGKSRNLCGRKYCFGCSPFKSGNTQRLETIGYEIDFKHNRATCTRCGKEYIYSKERGDQRGICASCVTRLRGLDRLRLLRNHLGGKCRECDYDKYEVALQFHHRDPSTKKFNISSNLNRKMSELMAEAKKCELLCANCHANLHASSVLRKN